MAFSAFINFLAQAAIMLPAFIAAVSFHEFSHALVGTLLGDNTAKKMGRLTLNPLSHVDPMGLFFLLVFRIGWAKPVPFDHRNFKHPKLYSILTALAGPLSNFLLAIFAMVCIKYMPVDMMNAAVAITFNQIFEALAYVNIMLGVFNLLPIPPLDGSHIVVAFLAEKFPGAVLWLYRYSIFLLIGLFMIPQTRMLLMHIISVCDHFLRHLIF
jgi:Zn-dependent protease